MIGIDCLAFVSPKGEIKGPPTVGVTKVEKRGNGVFLLNHQLRPGAKVQVSSLPNGWVHDWQATDQGLLVRVYDRTARLADHGFVLKVEAPKEPATLPPAAPVPEFTTTVRGALGAGEEPKEPILASTMGEDAPAPVPSETADGPSEESKPADDASASTTSSSSTKRKERR